MNVQAGACFSLDGRTALLTGASGFLGRTMAQTLLCNGATLIALGRSERVLDLADEWASEHGRDRVSAYRVDMHDADALSSTLDQIVGREAPIDVLVNNAHEMGEATGFNSLDGTLERAPLSQWMRNLTAGVLWAVQTTQRIGPGMKDRGGGSIVNVATMYALVAPHPDLYAGTSFANPPGYSVAKAGLVAFTRYVASYWGRYGVRANAILPGPFSNTEADGPNAVAADDPFLVRLGQRTCLGRVGRPDELAGALLFLASDASSYVTGHALVVDGGWTTT